MREFDRQISFLRSALTDDGFSQVAEYVPHGLPVWASKKDVSDAERLRASELQSNITARFVVRWSDFTADLTPKDRIVCDGREYDITGIKEIGGRRRMLEITAAARSDK